MAVKQIINDFRSNLAGEKIKNEIACFRSLSKAITKNYKCYSKEIHGTRFQVRFKPQRLNPHRSLARCELCDVLYIIFSNKEIRISFVQAKREYKSLPYIKCTHALKTSLEQWDLLYFQPSVVSANKKTFIPRDILKSNYKSISSFIFFHPENSSFDLIYSSASSLWPIKQYQGNQGKVRYQVGLKNQINESLHECNLNNFLFQLISGKIGSPLWPMQNGRYEQLQYVHTVVQLLIQEKHRDDLNSELLLELAEMTTRLLDRPNLEKTKTTPFIPRFVSIIKREDLQSGYQPLSYRMIMEDD